MFLSVESCGVQGSLVQYEKEAKNEDGLGGEDVQCEAAPCRPPPLRNEESNAHAERREQKPSSDTESGALDVLPDVSRTRASSPKRDVSDERGALDELPDDFAAQGGGSDSEDVGSLDLDAEAGELDLDLADSDGGGLDLDVDADAADFASDALGASVEGINPTSDSPGGSSDFELLSGGSAVSGRSAESRQGL